MYCVLINFTSSLFILIELFPVPLLLCTMSSSPAWKSTNTRQLWERTFLDNGFHQGLLCGDTTALPQTAGLIPSLHSISTFHGCLFDKKKMDEKFQELTYWESQYDWNTNARSIVVWLQGDDLHSRPWLEFTLDSRGRWKGKVIAQQAFRQGMCLGPVRPAKVYRQALSEPFAPQSYDKASKILRRNRAGVFAAFRDRQGVARPVILHDRPSLERLDFRNLPASGLGLQLIPCSSSPQLHNVALCEDGMVYATRDIGTGEALYLPPTKEYL